ncbi:unnamed protein product [Aphanomyces euteiches]
MDGGDADIDHVRGKDIVLEILREVHDYFLTNDPSKKANGTIWHGLDRAKLAAVCAAQIDNTLHNDNEANPADDDSQTQEYAVIQEILAGLIEKRLLATQAQLTQGPVDVACLQHQFMSMTSKQVQTNESISTKSDVKVLAFWALDELHKRSSVDHLRDTIRAQDALIQAMQREIDALRQSPKDDSTIGIQWTNVDLDASIDDLRDIVQDSHRNNLDILRDHIRALEGQLADATRYNAEVAKLNHHLKQELAENQPENDFVSSMSMLQRQIHDLETALAKATSHNEALEAELAVPGANLAYLSRQNTLLQQRVNIYKNELDAQIALLRRLEPTKDNGSECPTHFNGPCSDLMEALRTEILTAREQHRSEMVGLLEHISQLTQENHALRDPHLAAQLSENNLEQLSDEHPTRSVHAENAALLAQIQAYEATIATTEEAMGRLRRERELQEKEVDALLEKINPLVLAHEKIVAEKSQMEEDLTRRDEMIHALQASVYEMKREIKVVTADFDAIVEEKESLVEELEEWRKKRENGEEGSCETCVGLNNQIEELSQEQLDQMQEALETAEAEVRPLKKSLASKEQTIQESNHRVSELERRISHDKVEFDKAVSERDRAIEALQSRVHDLKREVNVLTDDYDSIYEEKQELEQKLDEVETQLVNLQDELAEMDQLVSRLRLEIETWRMWYEQVMMLREEERTFKVNFDVAFIDLQTKLIQETNRADELKTATDDMHSAQTNLLAQRDEDINKLKDAVIQLKDRLAVSILSEEQLKEQLQLALEDKAASEAEKDSIAEAKEQKLIKQLEELMANREATDMEWENKWLAMHEENQTVRSDLEDVSRQLRQENLRLESTLAALQAQHNTNLDEKNTVLADLHAKLSDLEISKATMAADIARLEQEKLAEVDELNQSRGELQLRSRSLEDELEHLKSAVNTLNVEKAEWEKKAYELNIAVEDQFSLRKELEIMFTNKEGEFNDVLQQLQDKISSLTKSESNLKNQLDEVKQLKSEVDASLDDYKRQLKISSSEYSELEKTATSLVQANDGLTNQVNSLKHSVDQLKTQYEAAKSELDSSGAECKLLTEAVIEKEARLAELAAQNNALIAREMALQQELSQMSEEKSILEMSLPEHEEKLAVLSHAHSELGSTSKTLEFENIRLQDLVQTLTQEKRDCDAAFHQAKSTWNHKFEAMTFDRDSFAAKCSVLETSLNQKEDELSKLLVIGQSLKDEVSALTASYSAVSSQLEVVSEENTELAHQLEKSTTYLEAKTTEWQQLETTLGEKNDTINRLQALLDQFKGRIETLTTSESALTQQLESVQEDMDKKTSAMADENSKLLEEVVLARKQMEDFTKERDAALERTTDLSAELAALRAQLESTIAEKDASMTRMQDLLDRFKEKIVVLNDSQAQLANEMESNRLELQGELTIKDDEIACLQSEIDNLTKKLVNATNNLSAVTEEKDEIAREVSIVKGQIKDLQAENDAKCTKLKSEVDERDENIASMQTLLDEMKVITATLKTSEVTLSKELQNKSEELNSKQADVDRLQSQCCALEDELKVLSSHVEHLSVEKEELVFQAATLEARARNLEASSELLSNKCSELEDVKKQKDEEIAHLKQLLSDLKEQVADLTKAEAGLSMQLHQAMEEKSSLEMSLPEQVEKLASLSRSHGELELTAKFAHEENEQLKSNVAELEYAKTRLASEITELHSKVEQQASEIAGLEMSLSDTTNQIAQLQMVLDRFKLKVDALSKSEKELTNQLTQLRDEKAQTEEKLHEEREKVTTVSRARDALELASANLREDVSRLQAELKAMTEKHETISAQYDAHIDECSQHISRLEAQEAELINELNDNHTKRMELEASVSHTADDMSKLQMQLQRMKEKVSSLTKSEESLSKQVVFLTQEKTALELSLPEQAEQIATLSRSRGDLESTAQNLQTQNKKLKSEMEAWSVKETEWVKEKQQVESSARAQIQILEDKLATTELSAKQLENIIEAKSAEISTQDKLVTKLQEEVAKLLRTESTLHEELLQIQAEKDALAQRLPEQEDNLLSLSRSHNELANNAQSLAAENAKLKFELEALSQDFAQKSAELVSQVEQLQRIAKDSELRCSELTHEHANAEERWVQESNELQAELESKEEEIAHLQELFNKEMSALKLEESEANRRYEELSTLHIQVTSLYDDLLEKHKLLTIQHEEKQSEIDELESHWKLKCAELSAQLLTLQELLAKKDNLVLDLNSTVATADDRIAQLQSLLNEKTNLISQLEHLRATRPNVTQRHEQLSLPDDYALLVSENDQLRLGQENLNTIVEVLKEQLAQAKEQNEALPWISSFVEDIAPVLGLTNVVPVTMDKMQSTLLDVQTSIHSLSTKSGDLGAMKVDDLSGSTGWLKAIEESNALNDKADDLTRKVNRTRDIVVPTSSVSLFPDGMAKDVMSVVLEIVATFDDAATSTDIAATLNEAWHYRQRLLGQLVAAMHHVHPLPSSLPREEQVDAWLEDMKDAVYVTNHKVLSSALMTMHRLLYPSHVATNSMDLEQWSEYAASTEFADNLRQYVSRMNDLEDDSRDLNEVVLPFLTQYIHENPEGSSDADAVVDIWKRNIQAMTEALTTMHDATFNEKKTMTWPAWIEYLRSQAFAELVHEKHAEAHDLCVAIRTLGAAVFPIDSLPTKDTADVASWREWANTIAFDEGIASTKTKWTRIDVENQAMCDALQNIHAVLWPQQEMKPSMDSTEWASYIHSQPFVDKLRQLSGQDKAICAAFTKMHRAITTGLDVSTHSSMDVPRWTEYIQSDKFDERLKKFAGRLDEIERDGLALSEEIATMVRLIDTTPKDLTNWQEYVRSADFTETLDRYAERQSELETDSDNLHSQILPMLLRELHHLTANSPIDQIISAWEAKTSELESSVKDLVNSVNQIVEVPLNVQDTVHDTIRACNEALSRVSPQHHLESAIIAPPTDLNFEQLVAMMQSNKDDPQLNQLRSTLSKLEGHQEKWAADMSSQPSEDDSDVMWPDALRAMELAKECQLAAIHVLETHNRTCIAKTRAEIAMKCSVQRAFLRWKHKAAMAAAKEAARENHLEAIEALKETQLNQLIKFRKHALTEKAKAVEDAKRETEERLTEYFVKREENLRLEQNLMRKQDEEHSNSNDSNSVASDETKPKRRPVSASSVSRRRDSLGGAQPPIKKEPAHERVAFGSSVSRNFTPPPASAGLPTHSKVVEQSATCGTTLERLKQTNASMTKKVRMMSNPQRK